MPIPSSSSPTPPAWKKNKKKQQIGDYNDYCSKEILSLSLTFIYLYFIVCKTIAFTWDACLLILNVF